MKRFDLAAEGKIDNFILVIEGSIPNETNKTEGYWAGFGTDKESGQPTTTCEWITDWPRKLGRFWRPVRAQRTAASMQSKETQRAVWGWPTI